MQSERASIGWRGPLIASIVIGLVLGTAIGIAEGLRVLAAQKLFGQYGELVPWAILFDASALIAWELVTALAAGAILRILRRHVSPASVIALQIGFGVLAAGALISLQLQVAASSGSASLSELPRQLPAALRFGVLSGLAAFALAALIASRRPSFRSLRARHGLALLVAIWVAAIVFGLNPRLAGRPKLTVAAANTAPRLNVLIVTIDTLRGDSVGIDGSSVKTPNIDRVGHAGAWFTNTIVQQPNTNASHTSIFTGVLPYVHGVRQHMIDRLSPDVETLAEVLARQGYQTAGLYSWVSLEQGFSGLRGFQTYQDLSIHLTSLLRDPRFQNLIVTYRLLGKYLLLPGLFENNLQGEQDAVEDTTDGKADVTTDAAIRWLDANSSSPFFLWVHYYDPHYPYTPPPPFDTMYDPSYTGTVSGGMSTIHYIYSHGTGDMTQADVNHLQALYDGEISFTDQQLGRLLDEVDRLNLTGNTLLIVTGDHGESLGTLGRWFHGSRLNYSDIHVPLVMRLPGVIPANKEITSPVESIDIMPTVLNVLHLDPVADVQGTSLLPLLTGQGPANTRPAITMMDTLNQISMVTDQWHLIWDRQKGVQWLYDYHADPLELKDVASEEGQTVGLLMQQLDARLLQLGFNNQ